MQNLHIGIILDGNRRFAKKLMQNPLKGHEHGARKVEELINWLIEFDIKELTLYAFSLENLNRPKEEVKHLMKLFKKEFSRLKEEENIHKHKVRIKFIGKRELLDSELKKIMNEIEEDTKDYQNKIINFAIAYGGRQEILEAVRKIVKSKKSLTEKNFAESLWLKSEPDLIIRTGGEKRTSNFLLWQAVYSEWVFLDKMWPEFTKEDLARAIKDLKKRRRNFGR